jgi:hypothetical protein
MPICLRIFAYGYVHGEGCSRNRNFATSKSQQGSFEASYTVWSQIGEPFEDSFEARSSVVVQVSLRIEATFLVGVPTAESSDELKTAATQ